MIYKVTQMSGTEITIESEEALLDLIEKANTGAVLVPTKYGIINPKSISDIVEHHQKLSEIGEQMRYGRSRAEATERVLGESPFPKLVELMEKKKALADGKKMLGK